MSNKLILTAITLTVISLAYCAGKKRGLAIAKTKATLEDVDDVCCKKDFCEEDCSDCSACEETDCLTEADYENKND